MAHMITLILDKRQQAALFGRHHWLRKWIDPQIRLH
jgi:hypothetical protein